MRYVISDHHFGHQNIIEYTQRNFSNVEEMNEALVENWNETIGEEDTVIHLGDVKHPPSDTLASDWFAKLNGRILLVRGNHDKVGYNFPHHTVQSATISHGRHKFYLSHRPVEDSNHWTINGHIHRNHPFIDNENRRINVCVEVIDYTPVAMDEIIRFLERNRSYETIQDAREDIGNA